MSSEIIYGVMAGIISGALTSSLCEKIKLAGITSYMGAKALIFRGRWDKEKAKQMTLKIKRLEQENEKLRSQINPTI